MKAEMGMSQHRPKRSLLRLIGLTLYTAVIYLVIKVGGKLKA
jgi:hypothetical protein